MSDETISITTIATPWTDLKTIIPEIAAAGYNGIEIGLKAGSYDDSKPNGPWDNNPCIMYEDGALEQTKELKALLDEHNLPVIAIGSYCLTDDLKAAALAAEVAMTFDCQLIRVRVPWYNPGTHNYRALLENARAAYRDLAQISSETGIDSLIEIHDNSICSSASAAMRILEGLEPHHVGVIFDPANYCSEGLENIPMAIDLLGPFIRHVHVKDNTIVVGMNEDKHHGLAMSCDFCQPGTGHVNWPLIIEQLRAHNYEGAYSLEDFTAESTEDIKRNFAWFSDLLKS